MDTTFDTGNALTNGVSAIAVQDDGKVIAVTLNAMTRLYADGSVDPSFRADAIAGVILPQSDGRLLIAGDFISVDGVSRNQIARLMNDGTLDLGFDPGHGVEASPGYGYPGIASVALQPDGGVLVGGHFQSFDGVPRASLVRLLPGGSTNVSELNFASADAQVSESISNVALTVLRAGDQNHSVTVDYAAQAITAVPGSTSPEFAGKG